jgi:hypothetical protein
LVKLDEACLFFFLSFITRPSQGSTRNTYATTRLCANTMAEVSERRGSKLSTDIDTLALLGKKQVLKRRFGFWSLFAFAVCELITWETVLALFAQGLENGGPAGLVYGFLIAWLSTL